MLQSHSYQLISLVHQLKADSHFFVEWSFSLTDFIKKLIPVEESRLWINVQQHIPVNKDTINNDPAGKNIITYSI